MSKLNYRGDWYLLRVKFTNDSNFDDSTHISKYELNAVIVHHNWWTPRAPALHREYASSPQRVIHIAASPTPARHQLMNKHQKAICVPNSYTKSSKQTGSDKSGCTHMSTSKAIARIFVREGFDLPFPYLSSHPLTFPSFANPLLRLSSPFPHLPSLRSPFPFLNLAMMSRGVRSGAEPWLQAHFDAFMAVKTHLMATFFSC